MCMHSVVSETDDTKIYLSYNSKQKDMIPDSHAHKVLALAFKTGTNKETAHSKANNEPKKLRLILSTRPRYVIPCICYDWAKIDKDPREYIKGKSKKELQKIISISAKRHTKGKPVIQDATYDTIQEEFARKSSDTPPVSKGVTIPPV